MQPVEEVWQVLPREGLKACGRRCSFAGSYGRTPSSAGYIFIHFHTRGRRFFSRKNLRLQPQAPNNNNVVYPKAIYAIQIENQSQWGQITNLDGGRNAHRIEMKKTKGGNQNGERKLVSARTRARGGEQGNQNGESLRGGGRTPMKNTKGGRRRMLGAQTKKKRRRRKVFFF